MRRIVVKKRCRFRKSIMAVTLAVLMMFSVMVSALTGTANRADDLRELIADAEALRPGVRIGSNHPVGTRWVTQSEWDAFDLAIRNARAALDAADLAVARDALQTRWDESQ